MQIEGFVVDKNLNLANLKGTLDAFIHAVFGENVKTRPGCVPPTSPSRSLPRSSI